MTDYRKRELPNDTDIETLAAINEYTKQHKFPPTIRGLRDIFGLSSTSPVHERVSVLVKLGLVTREPGLARSIVITKEGNKVLRAAKKLKGQEA